MGSLKDQLLKAGLKPSPKPVTPQALNERKLVPKKQVTQAVIHQKQRNFCEECQIVYPDVELYHHKLRTTDALWMCVRCADKLKIHDDCRQTAQSDTSIRRMFRREYGPTYTPVEIKRNAALSAKKGDLGPPPKAKNPNLK
jgi:hypothetical protein